MPSTTETNTDGTAVPEKEPIPAVTALTDGATLVAAATKETPVGAVAAILSVKNDHSTENKIINAIGVIPVEGLDWSAGAMGAFIDFFDYGAHHSKGTPTDTWKNAPFLDSDPPNNKIGPSPPGGGGAGGDRVCDIPGLC